MGTSTRQPSPLTLNWQAVTAAYRTSELPLERVLAEVWRASQHPEASLLSDLSSPVVFACQQMLREEQSPQQLNHALSQMLWRSKSNTLVAELAKRAAVSSVGVSNPERVWREQFFSQITDYLVSRDISGFIGPHFRNHTVSQLVEFKSSVLDLVRRTVAGLNIPEPQTASSWRAYVGQAVRVLAAIRS